MNNLPILVPAISFLTAMLLMLCGERMRLIRGLSILGNTLGLGAAAMLLGAVREQGYLVLNFGGWPAPFGIVFTVDMLSALMVLVTMVVSTATLVFSTVSMDEDAEKRFFHPLFHLLLFGVNGSFLTGDLFNLFVWFEVLLVSSYALMSVGSRSYALPETLKYVVINALASALFLVGIALVYAQTGTLNLADLSVRFPEVASEGMKGVTAVVFLVVFGIKGGLFPLYMWLPRSYYAAPTVVSALFGGLLTKVGVYALFRVSTVMFQDLSFLQPALLVIAGATMLFGVLGALAQWDMKRILSYHIVSQIGYMIMGLGLLTEAGLVGGVFYIVHHILVKTSLFLIAAAVEKSRGTTSLRDTGGMVETDPGLAALFLLAALSLAGAPPLSGFVAKLVLLQAGLEAQAYAIVAVSLVVSFLTLFSMMKIFRYGFWRAVPVSVAGVPVPPAPTSLEHSVRNGAIAALVILGIVLGIGANWAAPFATMAAEQLLNPAGYAEAVLEAR